MRRGAAKLTGAKVAGMGAAAIEPGLVDLDDQPRRPGIDDASVANQPHIRSEVDFVTGMDRLSRKTEFDTGGQAGGKEGGSVGHLDRRNRNGCQISLGGHGGPTFNCGIGLSGGKCRFKPSA